MKFVMGFLLGSALTLTGCGIWWKHQPLLWRSTKDICVAWQVPNGETTCIEPPVNATGYNVYLRVKR